MALILIVAVAALVAGFSVAVYGFAIDNAVTRSFTKIFPMPAAMVNKRLIFLDEVKGNMDELIWRKIIVLELEKRNIQIKHEWREAALRVAILKEAIGSDEAARARKALESLRDDMEFTEAAKTYSEDEQSQFIGGDLGFKSPGDLDPWLREAAFGLNIGEISDVVVSPAGYHILRVNSKDDEGRVQLRHILIRGRDLNDYLNQKSKEYRIYTFSRP